MYTRKSTLSIPCDKKSTNSFDTAKNKFDV